MVERATHSAGVDEAALAAARHLTTATLHEAAGRRGALPAGIRPLDRTMHMVGRALPVRCPRGDNLWIHRALVEAAHDDVLVVDAGDGFEYGYWGEVMATMALARGLAGLVITGGVRDSLRLVELGFATFATGTAILGTAKDVAGDGAAGEAVRIGEVVIRRGDLIVGDADGVFACPSGEASALVARAEQRERDEADIIRRLQTGASTMEIYGLK